MSATCNPRKITIAAINKIIAVLTFLVKVDIKIPKEIIHEPRKKTILSFKQSK